MFPRNIVCLRNISINTLYKEDDDDDADDDNNNNNKYGDRDLMDISALQNKQIFIVRITWKESGLLSAVCVENNKLTVLNMRLDDLSEHALSVIDLNTKLKISPTNKSTWY